MGRLVPGEPAMGRLVPGEPTMGRLYGRQRWNP
jgi:hypothetical protein